MTLSKIKISDLVVYYSTRYPGEKSIGLIVKKKQSSIFGEQFLVKWINGPFNGDMHLNTTKFYLKECIIIRGKLNKMLFYGESYDKQ